MWKKTEWDIFYSLKEKGISIKPEAPQKPSETNVNKGLIAVPTVKVEILATS